MQLSGLSLSLTKRIENAESNALSSRLHTLKQLEGNPLGIELMERGGASLFSCQGIPGPSFNKVIGLTAGGEPYIDDIIDFYHKRDIPCRLEIVPGDTSPALFQTLHDKGFYHSDFHTVLYGVPQPIAGQHLHLRLPKCIWRTL